MKEKAVNQYLLAFRLPPFWPLLDAARGGAQNFAV